MKWRHILISILVGLIFASFAQAEAVFVQTSNGPLKMYEQSHALLIGNADYTSESWDNLDAVPHDIKIVGDELRKQGFSIKTEMNLKTNELPSAIKAFLSADYPRDARLLIYYSGHGWSEPDGTLGYIVPVDAPAESDPEFRGTLVSMQDIRAAMERPRAAKHVLFIFDSCFSGTIFTTKGASEPNAAVVSSIDKVGRQFITSGSAGQRVPAESLFAPALVGGISGEADLTKDGIVTGSELGIWLKSELGSDALTPQWGTMPVPYNAGDFVFQVNSQNTPLPMSPVALSTQQTDTQVSGKMEVAAVESDTAVVSWADRRRARRRLSRFASVQSLEADCYRTPRNLQSTRTPARFFPKEALKTNPLTPTLAGGFRRARPPSNRSACGYMRAPVPANRKFL
jgi:hypothetical protein